MTTAFVDPSASGPDEWRAPGCETSGSASGAAPVSDRVVATGERIRDALADAASLSTSSLSDAEVTHLLDALTEATSALTHALTRTAVEADRRRLGDAIGARHTAQWWARRSRYTRPEASRLIALGRRLDADHQQPVADALASGSLRVDQADVISRAVDELPSDLDREVRDEARDRLLADAAQHDARALRRIGKRILDLVAPEIGEAQEKARLEAEEARAAATTRMTMQDDGHGRVHGRFTISTLQGTMLRKALHAIAHPQRHDEAALKDSSGAWRPTAERMGEAFGEFIERYPTDHVPHAGGVNATVVVTIDKDDLVRDVGAASIDTGERLSVSAVRRLACEAGIIPVVLGGAGQPLDTGRLRRLFSTAQRLALAVRDKGCTAAGCDQPPAACHAHHDLPWSRGGRTSVRNGRLLCPRHHRVIHDPRYEVTIQTDNTVTFHRRT